MRVDFDSGQSLMVLAADVIVDTGDEGDDIAVNDA